jgi:hypothetical protein
LDLLKKGLDHLLLLGRLVLKFLGLALELLLDLPLGCGFAGFFVSLVSPAILRH